MIRRKPTAFASAGALALALAGPIAAHAAPAQAQATQPRPAPPRPAAPPPTPVTTPTAPAPSPEKVRGLAQRIEAAIAVPGLRGARVGVAIAEIESGRVLYARGAEEALNPASNTKIVTTLAGLALLGPEYHWKTALFGASPEGGVINGDLVLKGYGDPTLQPADLWRLVAMLASQGVRRVAGSVVVDDSFFDDQRLPPGFEQKDEDLPFRAATSAASVAYNAVGVTVWPTTDGQPPRVVVDPPSAYVRIVVKARSSKRPGGTLVVHSEGVGETTVVTVSGRIALRSEPRSFYRRIEHPSLYAGAVLRELLIRRGIAVDKAEVHRGSVNAAAQRTLAHIESEPLSVVIRTVNKRSNNMMSEQILKTLGAETGGQPGTFPKGQAAIARFLKGIALPGTWEFRNGSGLYDANRFSASQLVHVLRYAYRDFRVSSDFVASLAVAGADGTVSHRLSGHPAERWVRAKTGTLAGISTLSGYAGAPGRGPLAFAILLNGVSEGNEPAARKAQDDIADALVGYLQE